MTEHASKFNLHNKHEPTDAYNATVSIEGAGYDAVLSDLQKSHDKKTQGEMHN